jgi:hypothetical protein
VSSREEIEGTSYGGLSLDKVVPQHAGRVLEDPDECCHLDLIPVNRRSTPAIGGKVQLSQIGEPGESPIALLGNETMMSV